MGFGIIGKRAVSSAVEQPPYTRLAGGSNPSRPKLFMETPSASQAPESDLWGGSAAALVAMPSAVAFGVAILAPLGPEAAARGAAAGLLGAAALGLTAPLTGGASRLISAPCAPAAAVLGALAAELAAASLSPAAAMARMTLVALMAGALQFLFALAGGGRLVKFLPYPVVSGYLTGVAMIILMKQAGGFFGLPHGISLGAALSDPSLWEPEAVIVAVCAAGATFLGPSLTKKVPAPVLGLAAGGAAHLLLGLRRPELLSPEANHLVVGAITGAAPWTEIGPRLAGLAGLHAADLKAALAPAATLAALLSIDALKTCVVSDALTGERHDADRVLTGQGLANVVSAVVGGSAGSGTMGPTLINLTSGGKTRRAAFMVGGLSLTALLVGGPILARLPLAALAGLLVAVACRMADRESLRLLKDPSTRFDFGVVAAVVAVAVGKGLIEAAAVGLGLSILLFIREQAKSSAVRRKTTLAKRRSLRARSPEASALLETRGASVPIVELQGPLFFGTADQLMGELSADFSGAKYAVLDLRRVRSLDLTAAQILSRVSRALSAKGGRLLLSRVPTTSPDGRDLAAYLGHLGVGGEGGAAMIAGSMDEALEWVENRLLEDQKAAAPAETLSLADFHFMQGRSADSRAALEACAEELEVEAGKLIFRRGEQGDSVYFLRRGLVRVEIPVEGQAHHHLATFGPGEFFGEMTFLDKGVRSADALAVEDCRLFTVSRARFDAAADAHPRLARQTFEDLARVLALRLRRADGELASLRES